MSRYCGSLLAAFVVTVACRPIGNTPAPASALSADVTLLASAALNGREAGSPGADTAAAFLAQRYERLGLRSAFHSSCTAPPNCPTSYFQPFPIPRGGAQNVAAVIDGTDVGLRGEYVVIGAHYDHLGRSPTFALDRDRGFVLRPGADDNASGAAALLELARRFHDRPTRRSLLFVDFDGEELGLLGSRIFMKNPPVPRSRPTRALIDSAVSAFGLRANYVADEARSDNATFDADGREAVWLSTGNHADYHTARDVVARVNFEGLERVVDATEAVVRRIADR